MLYYVGDLDPEGLGMAQRLMDRFVGHVQLLAMDEVSFEQAARPTSISQQRMQQLRTLKEPSLIKIAKCIETTHQIGLQEGFIKHLNKSIEALFDEFDLKMNVLD
jgi:hypothetical protein